MAAVKEKLAEKTEELEKREIEIKEIFSTLEERQATHLKEREKIVEKIDKKQLEQYERVRERFPADAVVPLAAGDNCSGCFMHLGPQALVQIARGEEIVRCRGCGRILYIDENSEESREE
ncbi:MAG: hypothetical protein D6719_07635 [Candidatus Dadabacteria bacterium]|nr:MAG: hypothetical protein D6719_07635 [Candidatus Dadabacteria bacterium]